MKQTAIMLYFMLPLVLNAAGPSAEEMALYMARRYGAQASRSFVIDSYGSFATKYCQEYPSRKKEFMERVKKAIGRYPRWYADEIKEK